jgi:thiol-disulfide isomerase/thioredoxin
MRVVRIIWRVVGVGGLLALLVYVLLGGAAPLAPGTPAPPVKNARLKDGRLAQLALGGGKPTVVNFWATWCPPCLAEMPELERAHQRFGERVRFVGLAAESERKKVLDVSERFGISFDIAEVDTATARAWNVTAFPSSFIVDGNGVVVWSTRGAVDEALLAKRLAPLLTP